ncbi:MAG: dockerin type I domain-containing protein, partial [Eubacteriales bacterium]|nr:dockerin type I domain-containing protein [Eubacteriales bacterium]
LNKDQHTKYCTAGDDSITETHTMENGVCKYCGYAPAPSPGVTVLGTATSFNSDTDNVTIQLILKGYSEAAYETVVKGNSASYSIANVLPGTYTMKVMKQNHVTGEYTVVVGSAPVVKDVKLCLKGDANGSGTVDIEDAMLVFYHVAKKSYLGDEGLAACDTNADGTVDIEDAMTIFYFVAKKIDKI